MNSRKPTRSVRLAMPAVAAACLGCPVAQAGYIAQGAVIKQLSNMGGNANAFGVEIVGGSGPSSSSTSAWIWFPVGAAPDGPTHQRAYAAAMMAMSMGLRVKIFNYSSDDCNNASFISIYN